MAAKQNNITTQQPPTKQLFLRFFPLSSKQIDYLINNKPHGTNMARPRKAPAQILTANIPLTTWDKLDELRLINRSAWLNRVILDEVTRETEKTDLHAQRQAAIKKDVAMMSDPAKFLSQVSNRRILAAAAARIPQHKKRLHQDLIAYIVSLTQEDGDSNLGPFAKEQMQRHADLKKVLEEQ